MVTYWDRSYDCLNQKEISTNCWDSSRNVPAIFFIYDSKIIDNEQTTSIKGGDYTIQEAIYAITGNKNLAIRAIENHLLLYLPESPSAPKSASVTPDSIQTYFSIEGSLQDQYTHEPIAFGSVGIGEAAIGTITNQNGEFRLKLPDSLPIIQGTFLSYRLSSPKR